MKIVFRVDASIEMGIGHVMRCLTLADALRDEGAQCLFVCREHPGNMISQIVDRGHQVCPLPISQVEQQSKSKRTERIRTNYGQWLGCDWQSDTRETFDCIGSQIVDWLIVDHYAVDEQWEKSLRSKCRNLMVIDDLADRDHDCDLLLDQTYGRLESVYQRRVAQDCMILTGAKYALLRPEFAALREYSLQRRKDTHLEHLLISLGGIDKDNITGKVLQVLKEIDLPENCRISVVMGAKAPWLKDVKAISRELSWAVDVKVNIDDMAQLMADSDLAIGAAGSTTWERCCLGLPTLMLVLADNQRDIARALSRAKAVRIFDEVGQLTSMMKLSSENLNIMCCAASGITDGTGTQNVIRCFQEM